MSPLGSICTINPSGNVKVVTQPSFNDFGVSLFLYKELYSLLYDTFNFNPSSKLSQNSFILFISLIPKTKLSLRM